MLTSFPNWRALRSTHFAPSYYTNDNDIVVSNSAFLDTQLNYQFSVGAGYPLVGPGAQVQVAFGGTEMSPVCSTRHRN
jgi:hypothetical protein